MIFIDLLFSSYHGIMLYKTKELGTRMAPGSLKSHNVVRDFNGDTQILLR
jgi:hypothetical protein